MVYKYHSLLILPLSLSLKYQLGDYLTKQMQTSALTTGTGLIEWPLDATLERTMLW